MNMEINPSEYKVLIVDDVISNVLLLKVLLTNEKFKIVTAGNGTQALEQVKKENPDLVLLDVMMPDIAAEQLKSANITDWIISICSFQSMNNRILKWLKKR